MAPVLTRPPAEDAVRRILDSGRRDGAWFIENVIGDSLWETQRQIVRSVFTNGRTAVKACHASGKTFAAARSALAFFYLYPGSKVLTTAPTWIGVEKLLWSEIAAAHGKLPPDMGGELLRTELRAGSDWFAMGLSTDQGVRFQGHHADNMLVIFDEAPGVADEIWDAVGGIRAGGNVRWLVIGNPLLPAGRFCEAFTTRLDSWATFTIDAFDTPNLIGLPGETADEREAYLVDLPAHSAELDRRDRPYLVTRRWVWECYHEWGADSPVYRSRVRAEFPEDKSDGVVPLSWVRACQRLDSEDWPAEPVELGVDVGAGGDETVIRERRGMVAGRTWRHRTPDWAEATGHVRRAIAETGATRVKVDTIGIGWGLAGALKETAEDHGAEIVPVNVAAASSDPKRFPKLRDQLWWELGRELCRDRAWDLAALDETTVAQLIAPTWAPDSAGRHKVEPKEKTRARLRRSPDDADALLLAFYSPPRRRTWGAV